MEDTSKARKKIKQKLETGRFLVEMNEIKA